MSDDSAGGAPSNRPEVNATVDGNGGMSSSAKRRGKRGRKRRRKPRNREQNGVQAEKKEKNTDQKVVNSHERNSDRSENSSPFDKRSKSKRARRRRSKNEPGTVVEPRGTNAQQHEVAKHNKRRQTRRPGRDHEHNRRQVKSADDQVPSSTRPSDTEKLRKPSGRKRQGGSGPAQKPPIASRHQPLRRRSAYAALDLGTNNCRLLIAVPQSPGRFQVIDAFSRIVRLGEGLAGSGRLKEDAMDRAVEALKTCADKLSNRTVKGVRLIATEACRRADNGAEFLRRVETEAGLKLEIVDRETEARLAVAGCSSLVDRKAKGVVLFDIGGGSSELALLDLRKRRKHDLGPALVSWTSLPHGVVTLSEKHGGGRYVTREIFDNMVGEVSELLLKFDGRDELKSAADEGEVHLLGTSGTVTTLAGIHLKLPRYDRRQVDGTWMASEDVDAMVDTLVNMDFEERVKNPCIGSERADLVLAGCAILVAIQRLWPCQRLRVADRGLREGLLTEMMNADNAWQRRPYHSRRWKK